MAGLLRAAARLVLREADIVITPGLPRSVACRTAGAPAAPSLLLGTPAEQRDSGVTATVAATSLPAAQRWQATLAGGGGLSESFGAPAVSSTGVVLNNSAEVGALQAMLTSALEAMGQAQQGRSRASMARSARLSRALVTAQQAARGAQFARAARSLEATMSSHAAAQFAQRCSAALPCVDVEAYAVDRAVEMHRPCAVVHAPVRPALGLATAIRAAAVLVHELGLHDYLLLVFDTAQVRRGRRRHRASVGAARSISLRRNATRTLTAAARWCARCVWSPTCCSGTSGTRTRARCAMAGSACIPAPAMRCRCPCWRRP